MSFAGYCRGKGAHMASLLFFMVTLSMIVAMCGARKASIILFFVIWVLSILWFLHHATSVLDLNF
jgi:hypothetical protein